MLAQYKEDVTKAEPTTLPFNRGCSNQKVRPECSKLDEPKASSTRRALETMAEAAINGAAE